MSASLKVALAQYPRKSDPAEIIAQAKRDDAEIVLFPEMYSNGYECVDLADAAAVERWRHGAHRPDGSYIERFRKAARAHQLFVVTTFLEAAVPKPFNSALLIDPEGRVVLHHRKVHICDFDSPEAACGRGKDFNVAEIKTNVGPVKLGIMICMDREFPEAARALSHAGAELALISNCCTLATDRIQSDVRIAQARGRAFEMVMGIAVANYPAPRADGHSFAVDPNGTLIAMADDSPGLAIATFDLELIRRIRREDRFRWCLQ